MYVPGSPAEWNFILVQLDDVVDHLVAAQNLSQEVVEDDPLLWYLMNARWS